MSIFRWLVSAAAATAPLVAALSSAAPVAAASSSLEHANRGLPPTVPPPDWISNVTCYTPLLLDDIDAVEKDSVSLVDVAKATVVLLTACMAVMSNLV